MKKKFAPIIRNCYATIRPLQFATTLTVFLRTISDLALIYFLQQLIDAVTNNNFSQSLHLLKIISLFLVFYLLGILSSQFFLRLLFYTGNYPLLKLLNSQILKQPLEFHQKHSTGKLISQLLNDSQKVSDWLAQGVVLSYIQFFKLITTLSLMAHYSWILTLIISLSLLLSFFLIKQISHNVSIYTTKDQKIIGKLNQQLLSNFVFIKDLIQLNNIFLFENKIITLLRREKYPNSKKLARFFALYIALASLLSFILPILSVLFGLYLLTINELTVGTLLAIYTLTSQLQEPLRSLSDSLATRQIALDLASELEDLTTLPLTIPLTKQMPPLKKLTFKCLHFTTSQSSILNDCSFNLDAQEILLIKGVSGSGKSTIANSISRFLPLNEEFIQITWNGVSIDTFDLTYYYKKILQVSQEPLLFSGSLKENLCLGEYFSDKEIHEIMKVTSISEFIALNNLEFKIEHNGDNLSGGQKQRIALGRILLRKPELVILDEPTSALNSELSREISRNLAIFFSKNKLTGIIISHSDDFDWWATRRLLLK